MKATIRPTSACVFRIAAAGLFLMASTGCSLLKPTAMPPPVFYTLDTTHGAPPPPAAATAPTLIVSPTTAAAGFDSQRIIYVREPHTLEYFAHSEWVDPPARMLTPLLLAALESSGAFHAVALTPSAAHGELRLDTEIIRLQHEFQTRPSQVRFTLRAYLVESTTRRVLAWRELDAVAPAASEDPRGGVVAANRVVLKVLEELSAFCAETVRATPTER
jgi:cholesterol transport system auxiliary component